MTIFLSLSFFVLFFAGSDLFAGLCVIDLQFRVCDLLSISIFQLWVCVCSQGRSSHVRSKQINIYRIEPHTKVQLPIACMHSLYV